LREFVVALLFVFTAVHFDAPRYEIDFAVRSYQLFKHHAKFRGTNAGQL
jgi:hypothetical protein